MLTLPLGASIARGPAVALTSIRKPTTRDPSVGGPPGRRVVLVMSSDAVAAALLGALVETLGYLVRFFHPREEPDDVMRRHRPSVAMVDCEDPTLMSDELLGRARMRDISVIIFGSTDALRRVRQVVEEHDLETLIMPTSLDALDESLRRAVRSPEGRGG